jgi:hypothetical protein
VTYPQGQRPDYQQYDHPQYGYPPAQQSGSYPPPGYSPQQRRPPIEPRKSRKKWPWVVAGVVALIVIIGVSTQGKKPSSTAAPTGGAAPAAAQPADQDLGFGEKIVTLSVEGKGKATVTYIKSGGTEQKQVTLPWKADVKTDFISSLAATRMSGSGDITCRITEGSEVKAESTSNGQFATATCSD